MQSFHYKIAGLNLSLILPDEYDAYSLLTSFRPFIFLGEPEVSCELIYEPHLALPQSLKALITESNDMGTTSIYSDSAHYYFAMDFAGSEALMRVDADWKRAVFTLDWTMPYADVLLSSLSRALFAQYVILFGGVSLHASVVVRDSLAYMFMGKSGTGKSTHSRLWMQTFLGCFLLNDDNPYIRVTDDKVIVYGSPWSGKTSCYKNESYTLKGIARLSQAKENRAVVRKDIEAFLEVYPGASVVRFDRKLHDKLCDNISELCEKTGVIHLFCLPDSDAAMCSSAIFEKM